jgi:protocatechuate 3,4-dioxygenase beta subunit
MPRDAAQAQATIPTGTAAISGSLVVIGTGQPARRARVTLNAIGGGGSRSVLTDDTGAFAFTGVIAGRYNLSASKTGHVGVTFGQTRPGGPGTPIQLAEGEKFIANMQIARGSVITGTVLDEHGEPTPGTQVRVLRFVNQSGRRTLQQSGSGSTDDRGIYRVFGLQPGEYIVSAVPRNAGPGMDAARMAAELEAVRQRIAAAADQSVARELMTRASMLQAEIPAQDEQPTGYAPVYYPGTIAPADAAPIAIGVGEERPSVDFQLQRVPMARVEGSVVNGTGVAVQSIQLTLMNVAQAVPGLGTISARAEADGRFRIMNVPPGQYRLVARASSAPSGGRGNVEMPGGGRGGRGNQPPPVRLWGTVDVPVDGRTVSNVIVTLQQGLTVTGRIVFEGASLQPPADLSRMRVTLSPADPSSAGGLPQSASGTVDTAGRFTIPSVVPGVYRLNASNAGNGWMTASATIDGQDTLDFPAEIRAGTASNTAVVTYTDRQSQLAGRITNQRGQPAPGFTLILYAADERFWGPQSRRIRSTRPATDGQFSFTSVPPGDYKLVALADVEPGSWFDPAFLQQMEGASIAVRIDEGEKKIQDLQIVQ